MMSILDYHRRKAAAVLAQEPPPPPPQPADDGRVFDAEIPRSTICREFNPWYKHLAKSGYNMAVVLASPRVSDQVFEQRMAACRACDHSEPGKGKLYCRCCGCPQWAGSTLEVKNRHEKHVCPRDPAAF